ncbi:MAG: hypothetical protein PHE89_05285 [Alphaproteobacteria bacterium]|nr:hypothetical protein [Alphaproteobacteria bacterium]
MKNIFVLFLLFSLTSCASSYIYKASEDSRASEPKIISYDAKGKPWGQEIEKRLKEKGFKVVKYNRKKRFQESNSGKKVSYNVAETRYHLVTYAKYSLIESRCMFGGHIFSSFTAELIDRKNNQTMAYYDGLAGYSEGCFPMRGTIFGDVTDMVNDYWK